MSARKVMSFLLPPFLPLQPPLLPSFIPFFLPFLDAPKDSSGAPVGKEKRKGEQGRLFFTMYTFLTMCTAIPHYYFDK
jgi:hypothetical protein